MSTRRTGDAECCNRSNSTGRPSSLPPNWKATASIRTGRPAICSPTPSGSTPMAHRTCAAALYKNWIACNPRHEFLHAAYFNYSFSLAKAGDRLGRHRGGARMSAAEAGFHAGLHQSRAPARGCGQLGEAVEHWRSLIERLPQIRGERIRNKLTALEQMARVLEAHNIDGPAEEAMRLSLDISDSSAAGHPALHRAAAAAVQMAGWWKAGKACRAEALMAGISPLSLANLSNDPLFQLARAATYYHELVGPRPGPVEIAASGAGGRAAAGTAAHRLCLLGPARARRRLRDDRRSGDARQGRIRDLRLLLRHSARRRRQATLPRRGRSMDRHRRPHGRRGGAASSAPTRSTSSSTSTASPRARAQRCSRCGRRRSSSTGSAFPARWARRIIIISSPTRASSRRKPSVTIPRRWCGSPAISRTTASASSPPRRAAPKRACPRTPSCSARSTARRNSRRRCSPSG